MIIIVVKTLIHILLLNQQLIKLKKVGTGVFRVLALELFLMILIFCQQNITIFN